MNAVDGFERILAEIGLSRDDFGGSLEFAGEDPVVPSPHRLGAANAAALAAQAAGVACIWRMRTGREQHIRVDLRRAVVPGLSPLNALAQNGYSLGWRTRTRPANFFATRDDRRFYVLHTTDYPHFLLRILAFLDCADADESMAKAVARWNADELETALAEAKLVGGIARSREEWAAHPQGRWLASQPAVAIEKIGDGEPVAFSVAARPLSDIRVLDLGHVLAGPTAARTLAEQGADVLRISSPEYPDPNVQLMDTGAGKRSAYLDLNRAGDLERLTRLALQADVVTQSWRPGALDRRGLGAAELAAKRPGLIYLSVSCYGSGGPWGDRGGYDPVAQAVCGIAFAEGSPERPALVPTFTINDYLAAYLGAAGVLGALIRRAREGGSYHVSVSLTRASMFAQELGLLPRSALADVRAPLPNPAHLMRSRTAWGELEHAAPLVEYGETQAYWARPAEPLGASPAAWAS